MTTLNTLLLFKPLIPKATMGRILGFIIAVTVFGSAALTENLQEGCFDIEFAKCVFDFIQMNSGPNSKVNDESEAAHQCRFNRHRRNCLSNATTCTSVEEMDKEVMENLNEIQFNLNCVDDSSRETFQEFLTCSSRNAIYINPCFSSSRKFSGKDATYLEMLCKSTLPMDTCLIRTTGENCSPRVKYLYEANYLEHLKLVKKYCASTLPTNSNTPTEIPKNPQDTETQQTTPTASKNMSNVGAATLKPQFSRLQQLRLVLTALVFLTTDFYLP